MKKNKVAIIIVLLLGIVCFAIIKKYSDVHVSNMENTETENKYIEDIATAQEGDIVTFGHYEQDGDFENGQEELTWVVLKMTNDKMLLIAQKGIEVLPYNDEPGRVAWENSYIKTWLNSTFIEMSFNEEEQKKICTTNLKASVNEDYGTKAGKTECKVFLLSLEDLETYYCDYEKGKQLKEFAGNMSYYAELRGAKSCCGYWLRTPAIDYDGATYISLQGYVHPEGDGCVQYNIIRPVLWIQIEKE